MKKIIPSFMFSFYHALWAWLAALIYFFPSRQIKVIGVTGTNGKTTTCHLIARALTEAGFKVGMATSVNFRIDKKDIPNNTKQGMQGRLKLRKLLRQMVKAKCDYAIIETTSEGIRQYRHLFIKYHTVIITNVTKDHLEAHGGLDKYRETKERLFKNEKNTHVLNLDMPFFKHFLKYPAESIWGYEIKPNNLEPVLGEAKIVRATNIIYHNLHSHFDLKVGEKKTRVKLSLPGEFNIYNALAASCLCLAEGVSLGVIKKAFKKMPSVVGRMEEIENKAGFRVFVDYAHSEDALEQVYRTISDLPHNNLIAVLGATGGGRDKAKRPVLGRLARKYASTIVVTDEDPYDEDPEAIMDAVLAGVLGSHDIQDDKKSEVSKVNKYEWVINNGVSNCKSVFKILDRKQAIEFALGRASDNDVVIITGKGAEEVMVVKGNKKLPFSDKKVVVDFLGKDVFKKTKYKSPKSTNSQ